MEASERGTLTSLASGKRIPADVVFYSAGRQGATAELDLEAAGLDSDDRGRITVDEYFRTAVPHIYAVGDVIGFPSLASTSAEQGGSPRAMRSASRRTPRPRSSRSGSTRYPRSATSGAPSAS